jgi:hypothetical protein
MPKKTDTKQTRKKTTITKQIIKQVKELAKLGFNNIEISKIVNLSASTLSRNNQLKQSIQEGKLQLSMQVAKNILETLPDNATNQQFLVKRLGLFNRKINIKKPTSAKDALNNLATAIKQYADNEISESQLRTIEATANSFIKANEAIDLEARLKKLEEIIMEKKQ